MFFLLVSVLLVALVLHICTRAPAVQDPRPRNPRNPRNKRWPHRGHDIDDLLSASDTDSE